MSSTRGLKVGREVVLMKAISLSFLVSRFSSTISKLSIRTGCRTTEEEREEEK